MLFSGLVYEIFFSFILQQPVADACHELHEAILEQLSVKYAWMTSCSFMIEIIS